ncbi:hypothetical protein L596_008267 [Steinernema carpocapsae]|uniref:G-protein coupled receptors family 1 profile domain-containing protein n=1 Tax=Steinernema carpocapsae TaxID=34508 RepID=A0A4V6A688_STECR|nr:hypothetical protein L596_008267 [Steinernema carpocapsae]
MPSSLLNATVLAAAILSGVGAFESLRWMPPFGNSEHLRTLCTDNNHQVVIRGRDPALLHNLLRHDILCWREPQNYMSRKYTGLIWLMKALGFCDINRVVNWRQRGVEYHRNFQRDILRAAFALVCRRTDDIGRYRLARHAAIFRIMFEQQNEDRNQICERVISVYTDLYNRCHVAQSHGRLRLIDKICSGRSAVHLIKMRAFFRRFSRSCDSFDDFFRHNEIAQYQLGHALANDTAFMNMLSSNLITAVSSDSQLPHLVLKTRLLLQHFSLAAIKLKRQIDGAIKCELQNNSEFLLYEDGEDADTTSENGTNLTSVEYVQFGESEEVQDERRCTHAENVYFDLPDSAAYNLMGEQAMFSVRVEMVLLCVVVTNTVFLSVLLVQTRGHLSTATMLFIFNILFSNALFIASFVCLFSDLLEEAPYGQITEEHLSGGTAPSLVVAETLQTHLFAETEFLKHLVQETLYSLAQNGSLLGLIHLLVLVLVVINRSMSGKAIRLSRRYVICIFALVWLFLIVTHLIFSALQFSAITNLDSLFSRLAMGRRSLDCTIKLASDYEEIGERCDKVAPFHRFGVYLLRGHTLFTLLFLSASMVIFTVTLAYHWKVRRQHDFLTSGLRYLFSFHYPSTFLQRTQSPPAPRNALPHASSLDRRLLRLCNWPDLRRNRRFLGFRSQRGRRTRSFLPNRPDRRLCRPRLQSSPCGCPHSGPSSKDEMLYLCRVEHGDVLLLAMANASRYEDSQEEEAEARVVDDGDRGNRRFQQQSDHEHKRIRDRGDSETSLHPAGHPIFALPPELRLCDLQLGCVSELPRIEFYVRRGEIDNKK